MWVRVTTIWLMHNYLQDQVSTWLRIKTGAFKARRGWMLRLMPRHQLSYKTSNKKVKYEDELWKKCQQFHAGLRHGIIFLLASVKTHQILITSGEHYHQSSAILFIRFPRQLFMGWTICGLTMDGVQNMFFNQGLGYTSAFPALNVCIKWQSHIRNIYVFFFV